MNQRKKLLILNADTDRDDFQHCNLANFIHGVIFNDLEHSQNLALVTYNVHENKFPDFAEEFDGVIITGSFIDGKFAESAPVWVSRLIEYVKILGKKNIPVLGVCFGHQVMAYALGGEVKAHDSDSEGHPIYELGYPEVTLTEAGQKHPLFQGLPRIFRVNESHCYSAPRLPEKAVLLAQNNQGIQALQVGSLLGIQFHPEIFLNQAIFSLDRRIQENPPSLHRQHLIQARQTIEEEYQKTNQNQAVAIYRNFIEHYVCRIKTSK